jgi:hypothetical protein
MTLYTLQPWIPRREEFEHWMAWRRSIKKRLPPPEAEIFEQERLLHRSLADGIGLRAYWLVQGHDWALGGFRFFGPSCTTIRDGRDRARAIADYTVLPESVGWDRYVQRATHVHRCEHCANLAVFLYSDRISDLEKALGAGRTRPISDWLNTFLSAAESAAENLVFPRQGADSFQGYVESKYGYYSWRPDNGA